MDFIINSKTCLFYFDEKERLVKFKYSSRDIFVWYLFKFTWLETNWNRAKENIKFNVLINEYMIAVKTAWNQLETLVLVLDGWNEQTEFHSLMKSNL